MPTPLCLRIKLNGAYRSLIFSLSISSLQELRAKLDALKVHPKDFQPLLLSAEIGFQEITHIRATHKKGDFKKRPIYVCTNCFHMCTKRICVQCIRVCVHVGAYMRVCMRACILVCMYVSECARVWARACVHCLLRACLRICAGLRRACVRVRGVCANVASVVFVRYLMLLQILHKTKPAAGTFPPPLKPEGQQEATPQEEALADAAVAAAATSGDDLLKGTKRTRDEQADEVEKKEEADEKGSNEQQKEQEERKQKRKLDKKERKKQKWMRKMEAKAKEAEETKSNGKGDQAKKDDDKTDAVQKE